VNLTVLPWLRIATGSVIISVIRFHLPVAPDRDIDIDRTVGPQGIIERQRRVTDRPFAGGEIANCREHAKRQQNCHSAFHDGLSINA
jgi:hypothetical protein